MNSNEVFELMNQVATRGAVPQTPLHHAELAQLAVTTAQTNAGIVLQERALTGQLVLRVRGSLDEASAAVQSSIGVGLPGRLQFVGDPSNPDEVSLAWLSPDEWRLCCPIKEAYEIEEKLRQALSGVSGVTHAVVNNSGGFTMLEVSGPEVTNLLKKSTGYDIRPAHFPIGKVVGTSFAKTSVTLLRCEEQTWQLWVRRSFADYVWLWLQNAAREYGLKVSS